MARTKALSLLQAAGEKGDLKEIYGIVIDNVMKGTLSGALKSQAYTGNPAAGSVEFKRFTNSEAKDYGTARTAQKGDSITAPAVTVNLDQHKEIVEECSGFDLDTFGVGKIMARRAANHVDTMITELDTAFFKTASTEGTEFTTTKTNKLSVIEEAILKIESVKNKHVRGVKRSDLDLVLSASYYSAVREELDSVPNSNVDTAAEEFGTYHGVRVYSSINLPEGDDFIIMIRGAVAQPATSKQYGEPEKIPLSDDFAVSLFFNYGTKALTPDLIFVKRSA